MIWQCRNLMRFYSLFSCLSNNRLFLVHRRRLGLGFEREGTKVSQFEGTGQKQFAFKPMYFRLVPIKCFQCMNK